MNDSGPSQYDCTKSKRTDSWPEPGHGYRFLSRQFKPARKLKTIENILWTAAFGALLFGLALILMPRANIKSASTPAPATNSTAGPVNWLGYAVFGNGSGKFIVYEQLQVGIRQDGTFTWRYAPITTPATNQ